MNNILFDDKAIKDDTLSKEVDAFLREVNTLILHKKRGKSS